MTGTAEPPPAKADNGVDDVLAAFAGLDVCCVSDAQDALGLDGVLPGIAPVWEGAKVVGRAVTVQLAPWPPPAGQQPVHLGVEAIEASGPGAVIVVANEGRTAMGSWGGLLSTAAVCRGVGGVVLDGGCRDVDEARGMGFPAFARGPAVRTARGRVFQQATGTTVTIGDIQVKPGDVVVADGSGVVVVAAETASGVSRKANELAAREARMRDALLAGRPPREVLGKAYERMLEAR